MNNQINKKPTILMILDGFGIGENNNKNAIALAKKPNIDDIFKKHPMAQLGASGLSVGLPDGQMGNSEVGHLNIGAGRIVYQELTRITKAIEDGKFYENQVLLKAVDKIKNTEQSLHIFGLLSDGGVHSHIEHIKALIKFAKNEGVENVRIHAFLDGRDVPPTSAKVYIEELEDYMNEIGVGKIATISGRYFAMDRDKRWDRVEKAYKAITEAVGNQADTSLEAIDIAYNNGETDEFVVPTCIGNGETNKVKEGDLVVMANFRPDRAREITESLTSDTFDGFEREKIEDLTYVTMTQYDEKFGNVSVAYPPQVINNTLGEWLAKNGLSQLHIAETEKYAHVTFFFNGGVEEPNENEERILVPSPKVATYDMKPQMSAYEVTEKVLENMDRYDVVIMNFANADMVGHTGDMKATIEAIETLDICVKKIVDKVLKLGGKMLITADHGNADVMLDKGNNVVTAHSTNDVPLVYIADDNRKLQARGILADIAPTLLDMIDLDLPSEMNGKSLLM